MRKCLEWFNAKWLGILCFLYCKLYHAVRIESRDGSASKPLRSFPFLLDGESMQPDINPRNCRIVLVGETFLAGTYLALACPHQLPASDMPVPARKSCDCVPTRLMKRQHSRQSSASESITNSGPVFDDEDRSIVQFVQLLLETYSQGYFLRKPTVLNVFSCRYDVWPCCFNFASRK